MQVTLRAHGITYVPAAILITQLPRCSTRLLPILVLATPTTTPTILAQDALGETSVVAARVCI